MARARASLTEHAYLVTLGAVVAVIAASAMYTDHLREGAAEGVQAAADAPEIHATPALETGTTPLPTIAPLKARTARMGGGTVWPVSGRIARGHEPHRPVLWETLCCVQAHAGVDIAAEAGETVRLAMDGVVASVTTDELWGYSVRVEQTDGALATYAGLAAAGVREGQSVTRGQALGVLGEIPCEAELGPHLHLAMERAGEPLDPAEVLERASRM